MVFPRNEWFKYARQRAVRILAHLESLLFNNCILVQTRTNDKRWIHLMRCRTCHAYREYDLNYHMTFVPWLEWSLDVFDEFQTQPHTRTHGRSGSGVGDNNESVVKLLCVIQLLYGRFTHWRESPANNNNNHNNHNNHHNNHHHNNNMLFAFTAPVKHWSVKQLRW